MADVQNAALIRDVLDGGQLQFKTCGQWVNCGGDAQAWLTLLVLNDTRDAAYRIKPCSVPAAGVLEAHPAEPHSLVGFLEKLRPLTDYGRPGTRDMEQAELRRSLDSAIVLARALTTSLGVKGAVCATCIGEGTVRPTYPHGTEYPCPDCAAGVKGKAE